MADFVRILFKDLPHVLGQWIFEWSGQKAGDSLLRGGLGLYGLIAVVTICVVVAYAFATGVSLFAVLALSGVVAVLATYVYVFLTTRNH